MASTSTKRLFDGLVLPASGDFHVHLRDGEMMAAVAATIKKGGVDTVFVMVSGTHILFWYLYESDLWLYEYARTQPRLWEVDAPAGSDSVLRIDVFI